MKSHLPLILLLQLPPPTHLIFPASLFILLLLPLTISVHHPISHRLTPRQDCDTLFCGGPDIWGTVGGWLHEINQTPLPDVLKAPDDGKVETLPPVPVPEGDPQKGQQQPESQNPTLTLPDSQVQIFEPRPGTEECNAGLPWVKPDEKDTLANQDPGPCGEVIERLLWPTSCSDTLQNQITEKIISGMDPQFLVSRDQLCPGLKNQGAVFFWLARLTQQQVDSLKQGGSTSIRAIMDNIYYKISGSVSESPQTKETPMGQKRSYELEKRKTMTVEKQQLDDISLSFLSTGPAHSINTNLYSYLSPAGAKVTVYVIDSGLEVQDTEFNRSRLRWIYGLGVVETETDDSNPITERFGTCVAQKVAGKSFGVTKKSNLVVVKTLSNAASFIDALSKIIFDMDSIKSKRVRTKGRTVINFAGSFKPRSNLEEVVLVEELQPLIGRLVNDFQTVIVTSAGFNSEVTFSDIDTYPALLSRTNDIITVGSVIASIGPNNGARYSWSQGGDVLTVSAPGNAACMGFGWSYLVVEALGNHISTGIVSGLVAYFLSLPDLGERLRRQYKTPKAVIDYLRSMSYRRYAAEESVWNGLDSDDPTRWFDEWYGNPPPK